MKDSSQPPSETPSASSLATAADNVRRWDGATPGRYEVWYLTLNHAATQTGFWIRYTLEAPLEGAPYAQLWFARSDARDPRRTFGINRRFPIASMTAAANPFDVAIAGNSIEHDRARGALAGDGHDVRWDLRWTPGATTHRMLPDVMYARGGLGETTALCPNIAAPVTGTIQVDGDAYVVTGERVGQTHLWGSKHAYAWAWGHCNRFDGHDDAWFETLTVKLKRRGVVLPAMTIPALHVDGETHAFNQFHNTPMNRAELGTAHYRFRATGWSTRIEGEYSCRVDDMVTAHYHDPDGEPSFCANTTVGDLRVTLFRRSGARWREAARLLAPRRGHFEVAGRVRDDAVRKDHVTID
jgi:hypothetical protein